MNSSKTPIEAWDQEQKQTQTWARKRRSHERVLHRSTSAVNNEVGKDQAFSWSRCLISVISYGLLLSDVIRSGLGIRKLTEYPEIQPDVFISFGPYAYPIVHLDLNNATSSASQGLWAYKYDTTSIGMRSLAEHFELAQWPPCVLYKESCPSDTLPNHILFRMTDSLIDAVKHHGSLSMQSASRGEVVLRTKSEYKDRLHHYALPWIFEQFTLRTTQATHFTFNSTSKKATLCQSTRRRPYSCNEFWVQHVFGFCGRLHYPPCVYTLWTDINNRHSDLERMYPNHTIEYVVVDSTEDYNRGGLAFQGRKYFDVVTLTRIQVCEEVNSNSSLPICRTVAVDDYRYESAYFTMDAPSWFNAVALLRVLGQFYSWIRMIVLPVGCFMACTHQSSLRHQSPGILERLRTTARIFFLIPSQVVVYGSSTPIVTYAIAHLIDSPAIYELVTTHFDSFLGDVSINMSDFVRQCSVSMRTVWTLGLACQIGVTMVANRSWSSTHGIPGIPEFSISFIAFTTILAQYRSLKFRSTRVYEIQEVVPSSRHHQVLTQRYDSTRSTINKLLGGSTIDAQCLTCVILALFTLTTIVWCVNRILPKKMLFLVVLVTRTLVPYTAGILWPANRLVVSWFGAVLVRKAPAEKRSFDVMQSRPTLLSQVMFTSFRRAPRLSRRLHREAITALAIRDTNASKILQLSMHSVDKRSREIESMMVLVNLAVMTDPMTLLQLRVFGGRAIGIFESKLTRRRFLLPYALTQSDNDVPIDWNELVLLAVVNSKDLPWSKLVQCG